MTVVSAMRFNESEGAMVSDQRGNRYMRHNDVMDKIHKVELPESGISILLGASGDASLACELTEDIEDTLKNQDKIESKKQVMDIVDNILYNTLNYIRNRYLIKTYGISQVEFQTGLKQLTKANTASIENSLKERYNRLIDGGDSVFNNYTNNAILTLVKDKTDCYLYVAHMRTPTPIRITQPAESIGSGIDMADSVLSEFLEEMTREERTQIDRLTGLSQLLYATERAKKNTGVGGIPQIYAMDKDKIHIPSEDQSKVALEVVKAGRKGFLPEEFQRKALEDLVYKTTDFMNIEQAMMNKASDPDKMSRYLREYKH